MRPLASLFACFTIAACSSSGAADVAADAGGADAAPDGGSDAGSAPDDAAATVCEDLGVQVPAPRDDATYAEWDVYGCFGDACLCAAVARPFVEDVLACRAVEGGYFWGLGSVYARVMGRRGDACVVRVGLDVEAGVEVFECVLPLPVQPWLGLEWTDDDSGESAAFLEGIEERCESQGHCSLQPGGPNPCQEDEALAAPFCPESGGRSCG